MKLQITIDISEKELKDGMAKGWNEAYGEELTGADIKTLDNKDDIVRALPYIADNITEIQTR